MSPFCAALSPFQKNHPLSAGQKSPESAKRKHGITSKTTIRNPARRPAGQGQESQG